MFFFSDNVIETEGPQNGSPNTYNIKVTKRTHLTSCKAYDGKITLTSVSPGLTLPNPVYLAIHAACCRVAHLSGVGEYMDKLLEILRIPISCLRMAHRRMYSRLFFSKK